VSVDHYENFPVASVLCPPRIRPAVAAVYHFARTADDLADEGNATQIERQLSLQRYRRDLLAVFSGQSPSEEWSGVFAALNRARHQYHLPLQPLDDLLDAFLQDTNNGRYADRTALLDYCRRSANPVGRLLLHLYGVADERSLRESDAICSALQLINFWQDLSVDVPRGRLYVTEEDARRAEIDLSRLHADGDHDAMRRLVLQLCAWAESLMLSGAPLPLRIPGRAGWELRLVVQGGLRILDKIRSLQGGTLSQRPKLTAWDLPVMIWRALRMKHAVRLQESQVRA
jgi:hydroxysqualene synthase